MVQEKLSYVYLHPDGYVDTVLIGVPTSSELADLVAQTRIWVEAHGPMNILVDARQGRAGRDARSFSIMLSIGRVPKLKHVIILINNPPTHPDGATRSGIILSTLTSALGLKPIYMENEAEARSLAAKRH